MPAMDETEMDEGVVSIEERRSVKDDEQGDRPRPRRPENRRGVSKRDPGSKVRRLRCFPEVDRMVRDGSYLRDIVTYIQDEKGEWKDLSRRAVRSIIVNYRSDIYTDEGYVIDAPPRPRDDVDPDDPFYELHVLREFFQKQRERIDMEMETEKQLTKLFSTTHKEFLVLHKIGSDILKKKEKHGLLNVERGSTRQRVGSGTPGRLDMAEIVSNAESRQKIMGLVEAIFAEPELFTTIAEESPKTHQKTSRPKRHNRKKRK